MIRPITANDVPWIVALGIKRYSGDYDAAGGLQALATAMRLPTALAIRSNHAFLVANTLTSIWRPKHRACEVLAICAEERHHWEACALLRASARWAREQGCARWYVSSDTGHAIGALAVRAGAKPTPRYGISFDD